MTSSDYLVLALWRAELRAGKRTPTDFDALWRAACEEATAAEHTAFPEVRATYLARADTIIRDAMKARAA